jgi:ssDNA-binding Zn-finger/Zn-ribbon topoisomerase 1
VRYKRKSRTQFRSPYSGLTRDEEKERREYVNWFLATRGFKGSDGGYYGDGFGERRLKDCDVQIRIDSSIRSASPKVSITAAYLLDGKFPRPLFGVNEVSLARDATNWKELLDKRVLKITERARRHIKEELCPHCNAVMISKQIKSGEFEGQRFLGCCRFPECRGMKAPWKQTAASDDGKPVEEVLCPDCGSPLAIRYAKRGAHKGKRFYGCSAYPRCDRIVERDEFVALRLMSRDLQKKPGKGPYQDYDTIF